jgi:hypothetical protein
VSRWFRLIERNLREGGRTNFRLGHTKNAMSPTPHSSKLAICLFSATPREIVHEFWLYTFVLLNRSWYSTRRRTTVALFNLPCSVAGLKAPSGFAKQNSGRGPSSEFAGWASPVICRATPSYSLPQW